MSALSPVLPPPAQPGQKQLLPKGPELLDSNYLLGLPPVTKLASNTVTATTQ